MAEGFAVVTDELAQCGKRVSTMSGQADSLHDRATAAEVPSRSWGLLGELTTHSKYRDLQNQLTDHLSAMAGGLDNAGQRISNTADLYREIDEYHRKEIEQAGGDGKDPGRTGNGDPGPGGTDQHGGTAGGPAGGDPGSSGPSTGGPGAGGPVGSGGPVGGGGRHAAPPSYPPAEPGGRPPQVSAPDPGMTPDPAQHAPASTHGKITVEVEGGGPVTVEVTGEAHEDVEVKGDIQQADGQTEHVDVHARTDNAGHAKVALKDPAYEHLSGTLLPDTAEEQA